MSEPRQRGPRALPLALLAALVLAAIMAGGLNANLVARSGAAAGGPEQVCNVIVKNLTSQTGAIERIETTVKQLGPQNESLEKLSANVAAMSQRSTAQRETFAHMVSDLSDLRAQLNALKSDLHKALKEAKASSDAAAAAAAAASKQAQAALAASKGRAGPRQGGGAEGSVVVLNKVGVRNVTFGGADAVVVGLRDDNLAGGEVLKTGRLDGADKLAAMLAWVKPESTVVDAGW
ncbi:hypothetical protein MNEG_9990 [Monoraphidium neglectum]|uniref:Uncharacterized protein n=1 Tax=Monoraphidium neglectum TaxID=145388 RepID=A0A0D2M2X7_9CHLO|nr:hypothetical protein MNEG_9990 [Monoraphidium neglectum]KIY97974.1 hypothetical protein MNEG_9990 [Monoraphidium neglectum]|eukprot:XP_013896994.1 hypothetical protein MNEG_9990 [Monoraphidium neglectum]